MIDTIRFNIFGWFFTNERRFHPDIRFTGVGLCPGSVPSFRAFECSLPKLLFGHNGRLLCNQEELDAALQKLWHEVTAMADLTPFDTWRPSRIDLVWHFAGLKAGRIIDAQSGSRYPGIRTPPMHVAGRSLSFKGAGSRFMVGLYDKPRQMRVDGDVLRVEVRFAGKEICRLKARDWRNFGQLWTTYRENVVVLPDVPKPGTASDWQTAMAIHVPREFHAPVLASLNCSPRSQRLYRQRIRVAAAQLPETIHWANLLPVDGPTAPVHVERPDRQPMRYGRASTSAQPTIDHSDVISAMSLQDLKTTPQHHN